MSRVRRVLTALALVVVSLPVLTGAGNGNSNADAARAEHQRIVDFWTHERVAQAVPRDFVFDPGTGRYTPAHHRPGHPGGPGGPGGGDGDSTVVTGDPYNDGGTVDGTTGKVLFAMGSSYYVCSASVIQDTNINSSLILTAGHCAYDETNGAFASNWTFIPDYDAAPAPLSTSSNSYCEDTAYGCWTATALVVHSGFATAGGFNDQAVAHDWAFAVVGDGGNFGSDDLVEDLVGAQAYSFDAVSIDNSVTGHAFGYPAAQKYKGNDLIYCSNTIDGDPYNDNDTYRMNGCRMTGGSSGGPWFQNFGGGIGTLISVNSYGYTGVHAMHGPFFNGNTEDTYNAALGATGNTTVP